MSDELSGEVLTVLAHGWLNSMSVVSGAASTLCKYGDGLPAADRNRLLDMIARQATFLAEEWHDLIA